MLVKTANRIFVCAPRVVFQNVRKYSVNSKENVTNDTRNFHGESKGAFPHNNNHKFPVIQTSGFTSNGSDFPDENIQERVLKVSIIGMPNAGKSTFINALMDRKVCATSSKVHTTRAKSKAIFTAEDAQIVFLDTPGLVNDREQKKFNLESSFLRDPKKSSHEADIIGVIHDVSNSWTRDTADIKVINILEKYEHTPSFLVLNKVDTLKSKRKLLDITRQITENHINGMLTPDVKPLKPRENVKGWRNFQEVFMVSSLTGNGLEEVRNYLIGQAKPGKWLFPADVWSDQTPESIILNTIKATLLNFLPQELPYEIKPQMEFFETNNEGVITTVVILKCPDKRRAMLVKGGNDGKLIQIMQDVQKDLQEAFYQHVRLQIVVDYHH